MESKKCIAILIGLFLMITFVYIFGSPITGYGIYGEPNELTLKDYPYPFIKNGVYNHLNIALDYQNSFDLGWELIEYIKDYRRTYPNILLEPIFEGNLIIIGDACSNIIRAYNSEYCNNLNDNTGVIEILDNNERNILLVSGKGSGLKKAVTVLENYNFYSLKGKKAEITGNPKNIYGLNVKEYSIS